MLCIAVTPTSRTLAKVDLLNAARRADLVELCLDHLTKDPDVGDLLAACPKPVIVSCRSRQHGGQYDGGETHRLGLLRQAIIAGPAYVELDVDAAEALPRFGQTKRLVAFHSPHKPLKKIEATVQRAVQEFHADAVKFTWPTPHLSMAWPLIYAVSQKLSVPVVGQGIGAGGLTFSLLARRFGSPWIYAALEKGMEDVPGQPTVEELDAVYDARSIDRNTRFVAFAGFPTEHGGGGPGDDADAGQTAVCARWNAAARAAGAPHRALPLEAGRFDHLGDMLRILKVRAAALGPALSAEAAVGWSRFVSPPSAGGTSGGAVPTVALQDDDGWRGRSLSRAAVADALAACFDGSLERRQVALLGAGTGAAGMIQALRDRGANVAIADPDDDAAATLARSLDARAVPWRAIYMTHLDALVRGESAAAGAGPAPLGEGPKAFAKSGFEPRLRVADATAVWGETDFLAAARRHGCTIVEPSEVRSAVLARLFETVAEANWPEGE
ncbi:bifunctional type I 3-dehydroquinate dehydratase/shikimate dehydrogenase [Alienimonas californiensis]|uniref:Shikimate 5-dehydrogenase n=1 Tax=Alienimonas californiensis TaxID=2527989 RepID=A0A517P6J5_9PLAN|nr:bifunctional type I 3-dehydroquinate dehydratase/shikimate dehydrogenase [Alienimonas californiensis]QDT14987.1 shikimate 5-dehydrogenase [Alienimonas californiensis]